MGPRATVNAVDQSILRFADRVRANFAATAVCLYGSRVKGGWDEWSDYDVIVVSPWFQGVSIWHRGHDLDRLWYDDLGERAPLSLKCLTPVEFERQPHGLTFLNEILKHARKIA